MADGTGETGEALDAARGALAARDGDLAAADSALIALLGAAHRTAADCARRIDAVRAEIKAAVARGPAGSAASAREFGAFLVAKNREIIGIVTEARADAAAKTVALQSLGERYRGTAQQ